MSTRYLMLEMRRVARSARFLIFTLAFPVVMFVFLNGVYGKVPEASAVLMVSMTTWGAFSAALFTGSRVAIERGAGWQRQLRLTPLTGAGYLIGKGIVGMLVAVPAVVFVPLVGGLFEGVSLTPEQWLRVTLGIWLGAIPFALLGLLLGQFGTPDSMQAITSVVMMVMAMLGGVFLQLEDMPHWLAQIARVVPSYWMNQLGRGAIDPQESLGMCALVLGAWAVGLAALIVRRYRRDSARA